MRIAVTGANGLLGGEAVLRLAGLRDAAPLDFGSLRSPTLG